MPPVANRDLLLGRIAGPLPAIDRLQRHRMNIRVFIVQYPYLLDCWPTKLSVYWGLDTYTNRLQAVAFALTLAENTVLSPTAYERLVLNEFIQGLLTLDEAEKRMELHRCQGPTAAVQRDLR